MAPWSGPTCTTPYAHSSWPALGYSSFLFPLFSSDLGLSKTDVNNIVVLGQIFVYACIFAIERLEGYYGRWWVSTTAIALLGAVFLLFSVRTTLAWSVAVIAFWNHARCAQPRTHCTAVRARCVAGCHGQRGRNGNRAALCYLLIAVRPRNP